MDFKTRWDLVTRNTEEIIIESELKQLLKKSGVSAYFGTAPTGPYHMAYIIPLSKVFDLTNAKVKTIILLADIHAALDDLKTPWKEIDKRARYYQKCIELAFPWKKKPKFVWGSSFQLEKDYHLDLLKMATIMTATRAKRAASGVCRLKEPKVSELIYPIMQALDEEYLKVDIQTGGMDQRHVMVAAREYLPKLGYKPRVELITPLMASISGPGSKMSASIPSTHIKVYEPEDGIKKKIQSAYCPQGIIKENPITQICRFIIFPSKGKMFIKRPTKFGGDVTFNSYKELEKAFVSKQLHPVDLKNAVSEDLIILFKKARRYFEKHRDFLKELGPEFLA